MALQPSFNSSGLPNQLMSEEEIRQYFVRNGGVVKNTEIVNYFRTYLSNPAIKDEARIIFKTYVNKLANVKVENGEKFLVLKRQYFPPIDGNGNGNASGLPPVNSYPPATHYPQQQNQQHPNYVHNAYQYNHQPNQRLSVSSTSSHYTSQMNSYPGGGGGGPPPYGYPPPVSSTHNSLRRQNSQSQIYGSHFSLNSNYADPYTSQSQFNNNSNSGMSQYYQQMSAGLGHGHGGSTFSLASQYTTASSAGVPPYSNNPYHHQQQHQQPQLHHQAQQVPMQQSTHPPQPQQPPYVQPQLQRSLSQTYVQQQHHHYNQPVSQMQQYSQQQQQPLMPKNTNISGYTNASPGHRVDYPPEYGLPPVNSSSSVHVGSPQNQHPPQTHRHLSPQNSGGSGSGSRAPPPYRPPPPATNNNAYGSPTSPTGPPPVRSTNHQLNNHMRRSSLSSSSMSGGAGVSAIRFNRSPSVPGGPMMSQYPGGSIQNINSVQYQEQYNGGINSFPYQRSTSVSGITGAGAGQQVGPPPSSSLHHPQQSQQFQSPDQHQQQRPTSYTSDETNSLTPGAPPPPVPPRHKRGIERSPSAVSSATSGSSSNANFPGSKSTGAAAPSNFGGNRISNRRTNNNMDVMNGNSSNFAAAPVGATMNGMENDHEKENINLVNGTNGNFEENSNSNSNSTSINGSMSDGPNDNNNVMQNGDSSETEQKISVRERMQKFNRIASESELAANKMSSASKSKKEIASKHDSVDFDTASLSSYGYGYSHTQLEPRAKEWMLKAAQCDYHVLYKLAQENPSLVRRRDMNYTCLHWAAKKGHVELVKMLAGTYQCDVNAKSNGGYTPLHLAAQFSRQEVYDLLVKAYNADVNIRDHSGKKPMQYLVRQDTSVSMDTFKKIKEKRRSNEMHRDKDSSFLRIGSLNVKVKSTREAFGYLLGKSSSSSGMERIHKNWGSADNIPEADGNGDKDKQMMPPPPSIPSGSTRKKKTRRVNGTSPASIKENTSDSDSDSACGFGSDWQSP